MLPQPGGNEASKYALKTVQIGALPFSVSTSNSEGSPFPWSRGVPHVGSAKPWRIGFRVELAEGLTTTEDTMTLTRHFAVLVLGMAVAQAGLAQSVGGSTAGTWVDPTPSLPPIVTTGLGTPDFTYGDGNGFGTGPNSLSFAGTTFASVVETPFRVGTITYFNGTTAVGTTPSSVMLNLGLTFTEPLLPPVFGSYLFTLNTTPNTSDPDASADFVDLPSGFSFTDFVIGSTTYRIRLTGFENVVGDGFLTSNPLQLHVREGLSARADLFAVVTTQVNTIPEPETYALMLAGLAAVGVFARRRRKF